MTDRTQPSRESGIPSPKPGELWRVKDNGGLVVVRPSVDGIATQDYGGASDGLDDHWTYNEFMRRCEPAPK